MHIEFKLLSEQVRSYELKLSYLETKVSQLSDKLDKRQSEIESNTEKELNLEEYTNALQNIAQIEGRVNVVEQAHNILKQTIRDLEKSSNFIKNCSTGMPKLKNVYICDICGKGFQNSSNRRAHIKKLHQGS